jgi:hypothetical protein
MVQRNSSRARSSSVTAIPARATLWRVPRSSMVIVWPFSIATTRTMAAPARSASRRVKNVKMIRFMRRRLQRRDDARSVWSGEHNTGSILAVCRVVRFVLLTLLALTACQRDSAPDPPPAARAETRCPDEWTRVADGIEYRMLDCDLHLVRVDPHRAAIDAVVRPGSTARDLGRTFDFAINANFFDENFRPLGVVMSNGRALNPPHAVKWQSVFYVDREGHAGIVPVREWEDVHDPKTAAQCGPRLVVHGKKNDVARADAVWRSGVCIDADDKVVFFVTDPGARFDVHEMVGIAADRLQCREAMLFDGGPSAQMFLRRSGDPVSVEGDKNVPAYVVVSSLKR